MKFQYNKQYIESNIEECLESVPLSLYKQNWYSDAHNFAKEISNKYNKPLINVVATISNLSPQNNWNQNKLWTDLFYQGIQKHTNCQHNKALICNRLNNKQEILKTINGLKTQRFFQNILEPFEENGVTIDVHMLKIAGFSIKSVTPKQYLFLEKIFIDVAKSIHLQSSKLQEILWSNYRINLNKNLIHG